MSDSDTSYIESTMVQGVLVMKVLPTELRETEVCYAIRDQMIAAIDPTQTRNAILDLQNVTFVGSIGLLGFLGMRRQLPKSRIIICNLADVIREMFLLCRLISPDNATDAPFEVQTTLQDALACFAE